MVEVKRIQPDNDVFCSLYRKDYVFWSDHKRAVPSSHFDSYRTTPQMKETFKKVDVKADSSKMDQYVAQTEELNRLRLRTTYRTDYGPKSSYKIIMNVDKEKFAPKNDKFLIDGEELFGSPRKSILEPIPTARRVFSYSAYDDYRCPLSVYQDVHGRLGYDSIREAAERGYWRMGPKYEHEKELADIKAIIRREGDVKKRETEEARMEEISMKKQLEEERNDLIKRSIAKKASKIRRSGHSSRFGPDPRDRPSTVTQQSGNQIT